MERKSEAEPLALRSVPQKQTVAELSSEREQKADTAH
jgi:hypothetical protein